MAYQQTFVSHACQDDAFVHKLAHDLRNRGVPIWISDWHRESGVTWPEKLSAAIAQSLLFVLVMSPAARRSPEVDKELAQARQLGKTVVPVWYQQCDAFDGVPMYDFEDFRKGDYGHALDNLCLRLAGQTTQPGFYIAPSAHGIHADESTQLTLAAPMLENQQHSLTALTLSWTTVPYAEFYEVQKGTSQFFTDAFVTRLGPATTYEVPGGVTWTSVRNQRYYRVRAVGVPDLIQSPWSNWCVS